MKKVTIFLLTSTLSIQAAMATIDCKPYMEEVTAARAAVNNYGATEQHLRLAYGEALSRVERRQSMQNAANSSMMNAQNSIAQINAQINELNNSSRQLQRTLQNLLTQKRQLEADIAAVRADLHNLPGPRGERRGSNNPRVRPGSRGGRVVPSAPRGSHARDVLTRKLAGLTDELLRVNDRVSKVQSALAPTTRRQAHLAKQRAEQEALLMQAQERLNAVINTRPTMEHLNAKVAELAERLQNQQQVQARNQEVLSQAQERLLMCKTYTRKYPIALREAAKIHAQGCNRYQMPRLQGPFAQDAANETFQALCNQ